MHVILHTRGSHMHMHVVYINHLLNGRMQLGRSAAARQLGQAHEYLVEIGQIEQHHRIEHVGVA